MNWKTGLLRAWAAFALVWMGVAGWTYYSEVVPSVEKYFKVTRALEKVDALLTSGKDPLITASGEQSTRSEVERHRVLFEEELERVWPIILRAIQVTFLPPLAVLLLGGLLFWVGRGFAVRNAPPSP